MAPARGRAGALVPLRFAWRELRGGLRGFGVFIACIALGVMAIAGVGSLARSLADGLSRAGATILGGDLAFSLAQQRATARERDFLRARGAVSTVAVLPTMLRERDGRASLVELKAVDGAYPLFGAVATDPALPLAAVLTGHGDTFGAAADPALLTRLGLKIGDRVSIGTAKIELRAALKSEPDRLAGGIGFGPRLLISTAALRASGLLQPGSLVRWRYRLRLPANRSDDGAVTAVEAQARTAFPDAGWDIRTRKNASPQLDRNVERFSQFLTLIALTALLIGGAGVATAVASHLARKRDAIATLKALGATGGVVFASTCAHVMLLALCASLLGAALGGALPFAASWTFGGVVPLPMTPSLYPAVLLAGLAYGLLTALAFALWPLGRAHDMPVSMLFRDEIDAGRRTPRRRYVAAIALSAAVLAVLAVALAYDRRLAAIFVASAAGLLLALRLAAVLAMSMARRLPRPGSTVLRLALANLHRPGALTPSVILSLGLGLCLLVALVEIDGNLHREFAVALPARAPSLFLIDIPSADGDRFDSFVRKHAPASKLERVPMLRGRIVGVNGTGADHLHLPERSAWVLRGDRGITYSAAVPQGSRIVAGKWWEAGYSGPPLVSIESRTAEDLNLKPGDTVTVNVLGRSLTARIANLRAVDWQSLGINFILVFSPGTFAGAPRTDIATVTFADGGTAGEEESLVKALSAAFPAVSAVRVKDALDAVSAILGTLLLALRGASSVTLIATFLVLGGALAAGQSSRVYDAVMLRVLGATRWRLMAAYAIEISLIGFATVVFAVAAGSLAAALIVTRIMELPFVLEAAPAAGVALGALCVVVLIGLAGTFATLGRKPAEVLRNL